MGIHIPTNPVVTVAHSFGNSGDNYDVTHKSPTFRKPIPLVPVRPGVSRQEASDIVARQRERAGKAKFFLMVSAALDQERSHTVRGKTPDQIEQRRADVINKFVKRGHIHTLGLCAGPYEYEALLRAAHELMKPGSTFLHGSRREVREKVLSAMKGDEFTSAVALAHPETAHTAHLKTVNKLVWNPAKDIAAKLRPGDLGTRDVSRQDLKQLARSNDKVHNTALRNEAKLLNKAALAEARQRAWEAERSERDWAKIESARSRLGGRNLLDTRMYESGEVIPPDYG